MSKTTLSIPEKTNDVLFDVARQLNLRHPKSPITPNRSEAVRVLTGTHPEFVQQTIIIRANDPTQPDHLLIPVPDALMARRVIAEALKNLANDKEYAVASVKEEAAAILKMMQ